MTNAARWPRNDHLRLHPAARRSHRHRQRGRPVSRDRRPRGNRTSRGRRRGHRRGRGTGREPRRCPRPPRCGDRVGRQYRSGAARIAA